MSFGWVLRGRPLLVSALCCALTPSAWAGETDARPAPGQTADAAAVPSTGPLLLWIEAPPDTFDAPSLQASLARELGREVSLSDVADRAALRVRVLDATHADVRYTTPAGEELSRAVDLPPDRKRAVQVVSWLTVNLVRDEATELLDELRARRKAEADARAAEEAAAAKAAADKAAADQVAAAKAAADRAAADRAAAAEARALAAQEKKPKPRDALLRDPLRSFDGALSTPLSLLPDSPRRELHLQLALGYGDAGGIVGAAVALGALRVRRDLLGGVAGLGAAFVGGNARGLVASVGYSQIDGNLDGVQLGAGAALQRGEVARGAVVAAGGALAGHLTGALLGAGFASAKSLAGVGMSAGATVIRGPSAGVVIAGGGNAAQSQRGVEIAGGINMAGELSGVALAPINVHRRVKGLQIGVINVAEEADAAIGVLSVAKNGRVQPVLWTASDGSAHLAVKSVVGYVFTQIGAGVDLGDEKVSYDGGIGMHLGLGRTFFLEPGVHYSAWLDTADASGAPQEQQLHYVVQLGLRVGDKLDLLAGGGLRHTIAGGAAAPVAPEALAGIAFF